MFALLFASCGGSASEPVSADRMVCDLVGEMVADAPRSDVAREHTEVFEVIVRADTFDRADVKDAAANLNAALGLIRLARERVDDVDPGQEFMMWSAAASPLDRLCIRHGLTK